MPCTRPRQGYECAVPTKNGKYQFTTRIERARYLDGKPVKRFVACRDCLSCRDSLAKEKASKVLFEAQMYEENFGLGSCSFITLTYNDKLLPPYGALSYSKDWTKFLNRLRYYVKDRYGKTIRYFMCGEYGSKNLRPHYHAIIFGFGFPDRTDLMERNGYQLYRSELLESAWTVPPGEYFAGESYGYSSIGDVSYAVALYVARYGLKKDVGDQQFSGTEDFVCNATGEVLTRPSLSKRYLRPCPLNGGFVRVPPERNFQSNGGGKSGKGGLGKEWFMKYKSDVYRKLPDGEFIDGYQYYDGRIIRPPKYFDKLLDEVDPKLLEEIKQLRQDYISSHVNDFNPDRLRQIEEYKIQSMKNFRRELSEVYDN